MCVFKALVRKRNKAQRDGNFQVLADVQKKLGDLYFDKKQHGDALKAYKGQLEACKNLNNRLNCAIAHRMIGEVYADLGRFKEALDHQNQYLELAQQLENLIEEQRAYATLGRTHLLIADSLTKDTEKEDKKKALRDAKGAFTESIKLCEKLDGRIEVPELMTMRARLLLNVGLVLEQQKRIEKALEYLSRALNLCKKHNLNEDLHRTNIALAGLNERLGNTDAALDNLKEAYNVDDVYLKADAQLMRAELVLKLGDWVEARRILYKLYKSRQMLDSVRQQVARLLKIAVTLCRTEDELLMESNAHRKAKLYERMGDAATAVRSLDSALTFYQRMLESAEEANDGQAISGALTSIAQTLRDLGRPDDALPYARRELENASMPKDEANSALFLAALLEDTNAEYSELSQILDRAVAAAEKSGDENLLRNVLTERLEYPGDELEIGEIKRRLEKLPEEINDEEEAVDEEVQSQEIGADVCLSELSDDLEDEESVANAKNVARTATKKRKCVVKKNEKGETQLHVACIKGNVSQVERLLEDKHPTWVRDNCGWTPLHEAANHGHVEICRLLLRAGANVNDPGGSGCDGVTALHDAASNGNAPVIQLLLDNGANSNMLTRAGECALCCLLKWRDRVDDITESQELEYEAARSRLASVARHKCKRKESSKAKYSALLDDEDDEVEPPRHGITLDDWTTPVEPEPERISAGEDYKRTIASLHHPGRALKQTVTSRRASAQPKITAPLLDSEEVLADDWLEDDLGDQAPGKSLPYFGPGLPPGVPTESSSTSSSKRKYSAERIESSPPAASTNEANVKRPKFNKPASPESRESSPSRFRTNGIIDVDSDVDNDDEDSRDREPTTERWPKSKRPRQQNLLRQGFTRAVARSPSPDLMEVQPSQTSNTSQTQQRGLRQQHERRSWDLSESLELVVQIDLEVIELKLHGRDLKRTMGDIEELLRHKFEARTGCKPKLSFRTADGVALPKELTLEELPAERNKATLIAEITHNDLVPIADRYKKVCEHFGIEPTDTMLKSLRVCDNTKSYRFPRDECDSSLDPLSRCLRYQADLRVLNLSGATLFGRGELLSYIISPLAGLYELHLQCCDIDVNCLSELKKFPTLLHEIDLSYNPLDGAHRKLHDLIQPLNRLQKLSLVSCDLGDFEPKLNCEYLVTLNLSHNPIGGKGAANLLQRQLVELNLGDTQDFARRKDNVIDKIFYGSQDLTFPALESLDLSQCDCTDLDVEAILSQTPNLKRLNLSNNLNITKTTLCTLLARRPTMTLINLSGCEFIESLPNSNLRLASPQLCSLFVHMKTEVIDAWEALWQGRCLCKKLPHFLVHFQPR
ncbi:hypothetical protein QAD02_006448 [Eretmocerus hayati]|uniref:Uncharacterized protein n=1 Tax=Eretmocerus hayati TaxID=131215 RepID=A0ACC2N1R1_9HYME|nr:hypothetical protein QAD02_006448 [Eretmocerus hayati]